MATPSTPILPRGWDLVRVTSRGVWRVFAPSGRVTELPIAQHTQMDLVAEINRQHRAMMKSKGG